jgi:hypothetical protein
MPSRQHCLEYSLRIRFSRSGLRAGQGVEKGQARLPQRRLRNPQTAFGSPKSDGGDDGFKIRRLRHCLIPKVS